MGSDTASARRAGDGRLLVFVALGAGLFAIAQLTHHAHALVIFKAYVAGLLIIVLYRGAARLPLVQRVVRPTKVTREGVYFLVLTLVFGAASLYTGDNLMHLIVALLLALLATSGVLSGVCLAGLGLRREPVPLLACGLPARIEVDCANLKWFAPSLAVSVDDQVEGALPDPDAAFAFFGWLAPRAVRRGGYNVTPVERGRLRFGDLRVSTRFPFGLFERDRLIVREATSWVLPRVHPLRAAAALAAVDRSEQPTRLPRRSAAGEDVVGLRDYRPGDPIRRIHWPTTARRGTPVVRELAPPDVHRVALLVDSWVGADGADAEAVEAGLRLAASLAWHLRRVGRVVGLQLPERPLRWAETHDGLLELLGELARQRNTDRPLATSLDARRLPPGRLVAIAPRARIDDVLARLPLRRTPLAVVAEDESSWLDGETLIDPTAPVAGRPRELARAV